MKFVIICLRLIFYFFIFFYELIVANFQIARLVLSPGLNFKSAAVKIKSNMKSNLELILITNSITLTPGTLVMDADRKSGSIWVHAMTAESAEQVKEELKNFPEQKVLWATRGSTDESDS